LLNIYFMENNKNEKKELYFWSFLDEKADSNKIEHTNPFPDKYVSNSQMRHYHNKLLNRIQYYEQSTCFNYLRAYYDYYLKTYSSKTPLEAGNNFNNSMRSLKMFTFCYEMEQELNEGKNIYILDKNI
jgi:hypothetical protein